MNLVDLIRYWAQWRPDHPAIIFGDRTESWSELDAITDATARGLAANGVGHGDRVGVLATNRPEVAHVAIATLKLGAISVPLNFRLTATELRPLLADSSPKLVVVEGNLAALVEPAAAELGFALFGLDTSDLRPYADLVVDSGPVPSVDIADDDGAFICYTSGTTGVQKGALLTHRSVQHPGNAKNIAEGLTWRDRILVAVPLVYTGAMVSCFMQFAVCAGGTMVLEADFDPDRYLDVIERQRISALTTVPVLWERMAMSPDFAKRDLSSLRSAAAGGAPVRVDLIETYAERGVALIQSYGMTEASGLISTMRPEDASAHVGYAGRAIMGTRVRIGDADTNTVPTGEVGEILIKGPHVMREYWCNPEATRATVVNGWLRSGDLGLQDADGFLKIVDRTKDMLISGGINVYPAEIEKALAGVGGVIDLAVIGVPDEKWGEVPMVVFHANRPMAEVVAAFEAIGREHLAGFKRPKFAIASDEPLPRTFSGKLSKPTLRASYPAPPDDAVAMFTRL